MHRSKPVGYDKNYNPIFFFHHDPQSLYVETTKKGDNHDPFHQTKSWHCIDSKQLFDDFVSSLDVRGNRERDLYEQLVGENGSAYSFTIYRRHLYSSNQKDSLIASRKREEEELERKMNNAIIANAESSRRSGRLASNAKDEVSRIQEEMDEARARFESQLAALDTADDYSSLSGMTLLSEFERNNRLSARCSQLWNNGEATNPGIIGKIAQDILELEEICNSLSPWKSNGDDESEQSRLKWRLTIEDTVDAWHNGCALHIGPKLKGDDSAGHAFSPNKKQRLSLDGKSKSVSGASVSFEYALSSFKAPIIELEKRIYSILGLERAVQEVDEANENMSVDSDGSNGADDEKEAERRERANYAWKKKVWALYAIPAKRASAIRDVLIAAIAIARKANISDALEDLRAALQLHRPGGGGRARTAALAVLEKYGFEKKDDDDDEESVDGDDNLSEAETSDDADEDKRASFLSAEAMMTGGSLEGDNNADRVDWKDAVTTCKTLSRFAALVANLKSRAMPRLDKLVKDKKTLSKAITYWETNGKTRKGKTKKGASNSRKFHSATEIWADVKATDEFVTSKVKGFPWWPARVCVPLDAEVAQLLDSINRTLVSFLGEQHLYTVDTKTEIKPLDFSPEEDGGEEYGPEVMKNLKNVG